ncbi:hypothetical protein ACFL3U_06120 [Pseudomonadota bacterium]
MRLKRLRKSCNPDFSPLSYYNAPMARADWLLLNQSARRSVNYACALFYRKSHSSPTLETLRYEKW